MWSIAHAFIRSWLGRCLLGDETTTNRSVFPFYPDRPCYTFQEVCLLVGK